MQVKVQLSNLDLAHATAVIFEMMAPYLDQGATLFADNYYISVDLADRLLQRRTHLVGTLRINRRGLPVALKDKIERKGDMIALENSRGIVVMKWRDKRDVLMISTRHGLQFQETGKKDRANKEIQKPEMIIAYNKAKSGIDVSDQLSSYNTSLKKTIRWYHKVAIEVLAGTCLVNAWLMFRDNQTQPNLKKMGIPKFKEECTKQLLNLPDMPPVSRKNSGVHVLMETEETEKAVNVNIFFYEFTFY